MAKKQIATSIGKIVLFFALVLVFLAGIYFLYVYSFYPETKSTPTLSVKELGTTDESTCPNLLIQHGSQLYMFNTNRPIVSGVNPVIFSNLDDYIYYVKIQRTDYGRNCPILFLQQETTAQGEDVYRVRPSPFELEAGTPTPTVATPTQLAAIQTYFDSSNNSTPTLSNTTASSITPSVRTSPSPLSSMIPMSTIKGYSSGSLSTNSIATAKPISLVNAQSPPVIIKGTGIPVPIPDLSTPKPVPYIDANSSNPPYNANGYYGFDPYGQYQGVFTSVDVIHNETQKNTVSGFSDNAMDPNWGGVLFTANQVSSGKYAGDNVFKPVFSDVPNVFSSPGLLPPAIPLSSGTALPNYNSGNPSDFTIQPVVDNNNNNYQSLNYNYSTPTPSSTTTITPTPTSTTTITPTPTSTN